MQDFKALGYPTLGGSWFKGQAFTLVLLMLHRCGGTVGAIMTCPLEVLKTRLQSSGLTLRPVFQVQLGTVNGAGVIRPGHVTPGLLQVLR